MDGACWMYTETSPNECDFLEKKKAVTPGQSVVIYEDNDLVAGGIILD